MSRQTIIRGTLILTITGIVTRLIGFGYRIFLSNIIGTVELGIYQMIFPVFGICATIYGSGIQTAISHITASVMAKPLEKNSHNTHEKNMSPGLVLFAGILLSLSLSLSLMGLIEWKAGLLAKKFLLEPRCEQPLRILAVLFPFCGVGSCINGWYYGRQKTGVPAVSQLFEQCVRVSVVYLLAIVIGCGDVIRGSELAVIGICAGEIFSCIFTIFAFLCSNLYKNNHSSYRKKQIHSTHSGSVKMPSRFSLLPAAMKRLLHLAVPLTGNRLIVNVLVSAEAILIPAALRSYGLSSHEALSIYGILTGMALPFLMFPSTITNSMSVLLLPDVAQAQASGNRKKIQRTCAVTIRFCLLIGFAAMLFFLLSGHFLGMFFYNNRLVGEYLSILAWLCPFLYLTPTLGSILNGLNKAHITLCNNVLGMAVRLLFVLLCVPNIGIKGYLFGLLISQAITFALDLYSILKEIK